MFLQTDCLTLQSHTRPFIKTAIDILLTVWNENECVVIIGITWMEPFELSASSPASCRDQRNHAHYNPVTFMSDPKSLHPASRFQCLKNANTKVNALKKKKKQKSRHSTCILRHVFIVGGQQDLVVCFGINKFTDSVPIWTFSRVGFANRILHAGQCVSALDYVYSRGTRLTCMQTVHSPLIK